MYILDRKQNVHSSTICKSSKLETSTQMPINRMDNHRGYSPHFHSDSDRRPTGTRMDQAMTWMSLKVYVEIRKLGTRENTVCFKHIKYENRQNRSEESVVRTVVPRGWGGCSWSAPGSCSGYRLQEYTLFVKIPSGLYF